LITARWPRWGGSKVPPKTTSSRLVGTTSALPCGSGLGIGIGEESEELAPDFYL
jgi:hypothetical protein